jgi:beta-phosphoglucomutase-like phosphatase (HAD superfamily)
MLRGEEEYNEANEENSAFESNSSIGKPREVLYNKNLPIEYFDFIVVDECHRSIYGDWRQVLEYFDALVCGTEIENGKPAPDIFLKTAELMGADPKTCFVFEDSPNGIIAGHSAGMKAIGIPDVVTFSDDIKSLMYCELKDLSQAIEIFEKL